jgi:hypothetical protein
VQANLHQGRRALEAKTAQDGEVPGYFAYAGNNPLTNSDPDGLIWTPGGECGSAIVNYPDGTQGGYRFTACDNCYAGALGVGPGRPTENYSSCLNCCDNCYACGFGDKCSTAGCGPAPRCNPLFEDCPHLPPPPPPWPGGGGGGGGPGPFHCVPGTTGCGLPPPNGCKTWPQWGICGVLCLGAPDKQSCLNKCCLSWVPGPPGPQ